ncbi:hypothetical protein EDB19DRAFT_1103027 [Suillus lakei]|nr:hypothetical protein EDB19DRAFT_1103027 [Suillus lakei]
MTRGQSPPRAEVGILRAGNCRHIAPSENDISRYCQQSNDLRVSLYNVMIYPTTSSRPPSWSPSPKKNQFRERRSSSASRPRQASSDFRSPQAPSSQYIKKVFKGNHYTQPGPHTSPRSSSLLERMELPSEERSLLNRMDLNEEALCIHINDGSSDSVKGWNTRISGSQQHANTPPELPSQNSPLRTKIRPTRITLNFPSQTPPAEKSSSGLLPSAFEAGVISLLTTGFDMLREPLPESTTAHSGGSASVIERCRKQLAPVLLMSAKSQDSSTILDIKACAAMLTDDSCREFLQQARDMKLQMDALAPHPPDNPRVVAVDAHINKKDVKHSMDRHGESTRTTRVWLDSDTLSIGSRKDSEATLVDLPIDHKAPTPVQGSRQSSVKDMTLPVKQIMEHDEALSPHDPHSANGQTSATASVPCQMAASPSIPVEDIEMTTSLAYRSINSGPSPADSQNIATCSSADSHPSSSLLNMPTLSMPGTWFRSQGLTRPGILNVDFAMGDRIIPAASLRSSS